MTATARHARQGAVTVAAKQAITMAGPCEPGDVLGAIGGDFVVVGSDLTEVAEDVLGRLLGGGGEMVTLVSGADDADGALAETCAGWLEEDAPGCRRRGVRRRAGALPAAGRRRVVARVGAAVDQPRLARRDRPRRGQGQGPSARNERHRRAAGPADRRRPAAPLPAPLPRDRHAHLARGRSRRASCSPWSARSRSRRSTTYQDRRTAPAGLPARRDRCAPTARRCGCRSSPRTRASAEWQSSAVHEGDAASSSARPTPSAVSGSSRTRSWCCSADEEARGPRGAVPGVDRRVLPALPAHQGRRVVGPADARSPSPGRSSTSCPSCFPTQVRTQYDVLDARTGARLDPRARHLGADHPGPAPLPVRGGAGHPAGAGPAPPGGPGDGGPAAHRRRRRAARGVRRAAAVRADRGPARDRRPDRARPGPAAPDEPAAPGRGRLRQDPGRAAGDAARRRLRRTGRAARAHRGARPAAPPLDHRACSATWPAAGCSAARTRPPSSCSPGR